MGPGVNLINMFLLVTKMRQNNLERLSLANLSCLVGQEPALEGCLIHFGRLWPNAQIFEYASKGQGQILQLIVNIRILLP
jgi:hypothetical protein